MKTLIPGIILIMIVFGLVLGLGSVSQYIQPHSIILVLGGTLAIFLMSSPLAVIKAVGQSTAALVHPEESFQKYQNSIQQLLKSKSLATPCENPLINYAAELWAQGVDADLFVVLLSQKRSELEVKSSDSVQSLKNLAKYPPALGMIGTVMGMVTLFASLDQNRNNIGSHLSLAMTATFFGLIISNVILSPLADRVHVRQVYQHRVYASIYEVLLLINRDEPQSIILDEVSHRAA